MGDINWTPAFVIAIIALVIFGIAGPLVRKKNDRIGKDNKNKSAPTPLSSEASQIKSSKQRKPWTKPQPKNFKPNPPAVITVRDANGQVQKYLGRRIQNVGSQNRKPKSKGRH